MRLLILVAVWSGWFVWAAGVSAVALESPEGEASGAAREFAVWTSSPYVAVSPNSPASLSTESLQLRVEVAQNEYENVVVNVTNLTDTAQEFRIQSTLPGQVGRPRSGANVSVQQLAGVKDNAIRMMSTSTLFPIETGNIPDTEDGLAMPLIELNGLQTFFVMPKRTRQIWFTVLTREVTAGVYDETITLTQLSGRKGQVTIPVKMTVWNFRLSEQAPLGVFCFDYAGDYDYLKSYKINCWYRASFPPKMPLLDAQGQLPDYSTDIKRVVARKTDGAQKFLFSYGYAKEFITWAANNKIEYMSPRWQELFAQILTRIIAEWKEAGVGYDDFVLQSIDEAHGDLIQRVVETTPLIRRVDPHVRIAMTIMTDLDGIKKMQPYVDVWITRGGGLWGDDQLAFFENERKLGKEIWSWSMPNNPKSRPLSDFRTYGWRAMKFDFDAIGFFVYSALVYDPYRRGGGFATRHWEAWRDGIEDYQYLWTLRELTRQCRKRSVQDELCTKAETLLHDAVDDVITDTCFPENSESTHGRISQQRRAIAQMIVALTNAQGVN